MVRERIVLFGSSTSRSALAGRRIRNRQLVDLVEMKTGFFVRLSECLNDLRAGPYIGRRGRGSRPVPDPPRLIVYISASASAMLFQGSSCRCRRRREKDEPCSRLWFHDREVLIIRSFTSQGIVVALEDRRASAMSMLFFSSVTTGGRAESR